MRASDVKKGQAVMMDGKLYVVTNADHNTPGNLRAKVQFKLRDVAKGTIQDKRVGATDDIATATNQMKDAELETGLKTRVPPFIEIGEVIRISTANGQYLSRA